MTKRSCELIESLEDEWRDALCTRDMDRLRALVPRDVVLIGSRATGAFMMGREDWLEAIQRRDVDAIELEVRDATALEGVLVGTVLARWRVNYLGRIIEDCVLLTDVWVQDEGRWQAIRRHSTPAPAGECAKGS